MATGKKYYWIKLTTSFLTSDKVDYLLSQKNGSNYIVIYQMLCLKTINNNGVLGVNIGEILIPYDEIKIQRDLKYFDIDTIRVALTLYKNLGMVYERNDGLLKIADFNEMVGCETDYASKKRRQRLEGQKGDTSGDIVPIEIEKEKELEIDKDIKKNNSRFTPPTLEEIQSYIQEKNLGVDAKQFFDYFTEGNWKDAKGNKVKNWKQKLLTWNKFNNTPKQPKEDIIPVYVDPMEDFFK